ncbi:peptide synthetase [Streptomyces mobaraensis]|uniref:Peptide synthetase n=1 Tax=Streptomyces mobaraensis TaxID=35621 RepID=A0A5N5VZB8_STRMB|nr:peptide synthetase [Streptomyces mobaraensis]KAB7834290.1 peptide synthetase [Streptomyces mobaraensis]
MTAVSRARRADAGYSRPISPTERGYLAGALVTPPMAIQIFVEGEGAVTADELRRAVVVASEACPGARLVKRGNRWADSGITPPVLEVDGAALDRRTFDTAGSEVLRRPFSPVKGPNCEVLLLSGEPATIVFRAFHAVMDGKGVMTWAQEVFRALRGEEPVGAPSTETESGVVKRFGTGAPAPGPAPECPNPFDRLPAGRDTGDASDVPWLWRRRTVEGNHNAVVARTAAALCALLPDEDCRFMVPVNIRRHDPSLASTANLSLPLFVDVPAGADRAQIQGRLLRAMFERQELSSIGAFPVTSSGMAPTLGAARATREHRETYPCTLVVSDLGKVDLDALSGGGFTAATAYSLPMHVPYAPAFLTVYQPPGRTEIGLSCRNEPGMAARADALLDLIAEELTGLPARTG